MQVNSAGAGGHVSVAAQQGMYANFQHQGTPSPQHHQGSGCDTYSMSQSQSLNFSQAMRGRPAGTQQQPAGPQQPPLGVAAAGISREQQAKMLQQQQQQMLRAQQQQMRPPPPEYKARFAAAPAPAPRRAPAPRAFAPHARQYAPDWRHVLMQQQPRQQFPHHHQAALLLRASSQQQSPMSHLIMQQNQMMSVQGQMPNIHMSQSQSMSMQQAGMGGMGSHQTNPMQSNPMQNNPMQGQTGSMHAQTNPMQNSMMAQNAPISQNNNSSHAFPSLHTSSYSGPADFNFDFLDNMPSSDTSNLTAQELLNSLDNSFLNDIL
ncbi:hypothetical protein RR48_13706 [Papilio machaon]|uniref:Neurogenic protein mastermind n=1 Tax=Papilio machaon TaxID=76193 RepID=A0A194RHP7_PAPMA|nr:hypothetical protein RR48_13706 [Papilio machaon]